MTSTILGLPLEYSELHEYFDALCLNGADSKNQVIEKILKEHKVKTVLDLTCGTGSQIFWLSQHGYQVTGADFSPTLLNIAKEKALQKKIDIQLIEGDMRTIQVGGFDSVITISNAIGHLTKKDFEKAIKNIYSNLNDGGLYLFDIFNLNAMTERAVNDLAMDLQETVNDTKIRNVQYSEIDRTTGHLTSYDTFTIQHGLDKPKMREGKFTLQIYTAKELREMLARNGFETLGQYGIDGLPFLDNATPQILTVAKKHRDAY